MTKPKKAVCPLLKKPCIEHDCAWFAHVVGRDPQSGRDVDHFDCSIRWLPMMMTEGARQTRGVQAAVETMRNDLVERQDRLGASLATFVGGVALTRRMVDVTEQPLRLDGSEGPC
ncbi:hypothetical protein [Burkholderia cenocepacia]|uniref:hypothetical protein n=1 Tax=Burkholderia cenocepacia TaxID=95486 RepID=UPI0022315CCF|nr:hypothetical protein [Burkholderia cenocepacia]MCW3539345.1 hypothetical protein [Burkholderia cenocepacia]